MTPMLRRIQAGDPRLASAWDDNLSISGNRGKRTLG
jgi:hypothetical protein